MWEDFKCKDILRQMKSVYAHSKCYFVCLVIAVFFVLFLFVDRLQENVF